MEILFMPVYLYKTPMNNLNDPILLFLCHLVIRRQTQPAFEYIRSNIDSRSGNISI